MKAFRFTVRLMLAIGSAVVMWLLMVAVWSFLGDHRFAMACTVGIPLVQVFDGWEKLGRFFPELFGDDGDEDDEEDVE